MYLLCSSASRPKSFTIFVTQPGVLSVYAEWTTWQPSVELAPIFGARMGHWVYTGDEYSRVGLTIVVYAVTFTCLLQSPGLRQINPRVLLALLVVMSTCFCQVRSSLNVTPRYLLLSVICRTWLCRVYVVLITLFFVKCILITVHFSGCVMSSRRTQFFSSTRLLDLLRNKTGTPICDNKVPRRL